MLVNQALGDGVVIQRAAGARHPSAAECVVRAGGGLRPGRVCYRRGWIRNAEMPEMPIKTMA